MSVLFVICMAVAAVLAALGAANVPSPRVSLLSAAVCFMALAFVLQQLFGGG